MLDMPETKGGQIQEEILVTANKVHETWATAELRKLLELQERDGARDSDLPTITVLIASFRQFLWIINRQGSTFGTFCDGYEEQQITCRWSGATSSFSQAFLS
jgi:hypothetical protein